MIKGTGSLIGDQDLDLSVEVAVILYALTEEANPRNIIDLALAPDIAVEAGPHWIATVGGDLVVDQEAEITILVNIPGGQDHAVSVDLIEDLAHAQELLAEAEGEVAQEAHLWSTHQNVLVAHEVRPQRKSR